MAKIFVTRKLPLWEEVSKPLYDAGHEVIVYEKNQRIQKEELEQKLKEGVDGLICLLTEKIDRQVLSFDENKRLKYIANYAVGYDNINMKDAMDHGVKVSNTPCDEVNESVAEFAWTLTLALTRRLNEASEFMRNAAYRGWEPDIFVGKDVKGKTLGIVGMGRIGSCLASRASGMGTNVCYWSRKQVDGANFEYISDLNTLLAKSDIVSLHVPLNDQTRHLISGKTLGVMKKGAILINTARGPVVDEHEVVEALRAGILSGYGADVFENEPEPHPELLQMENVILTPHIASATLEARRKMGQLAVLNMMEGLSSGIMPNEIKV